MKEYFQFQIFDEEPVKLFFMIKVGKKKTWYGLEYSGKGEPNLPPGLTFMGYEGRIPMFHQ